MESRLRRLIYITRLLIPTVGIKLFFPSSRDVGISYCRMLMHDTMLKEDSFQTGTSSSPLCECGVECKIVNLLNISYYVVQFTKLPEMKWSPTSTIHGCWSENCRKKAGTCTTSCLLTYYQCYMLYAIYVLMDVSLSGFRSIAESVRAVLLLPIRFWSQWTGS